MMNERQKPFGLLIIIALIMMSLIIFNRWINKQIDEIEKKPSTAEKAVPIIAPLEEPTRYGKPVIDPNNDPLAPMIKNVSSNKDEKKRQISEPSDNKTVYEAPQSDSQILAQ